MSSFSDDENCSPSLDDAGKSPAISDLLYFEDFTPGDVQTYEVAGLTRDGIIQFAQEWDPQRIHLDEDYAAQMHGSLIASGFQTLLHIMRPIIVNIFSNTKNIGGLGFDNLRWHLPVKPDQKIMVRFEITSVHPSQSKPDRGVVKYIVEGHDTLDKLLFSAESGIMVLRRTQKNS